MARTASRLTLPMSACLVCVAMLIGGCGTQPGESTADTDNAPPSSEEPSSAEAGQDNTSTSDEVTIREANAADLAELVAQNNGKVTLVDYWATW